MASSTQGEIEDVAATATERLVVAAVPIPPLAIESRPARGTASSSPSTTSCGAASEIIFTDEANLPGTLGEIRADGLVHSSHELDPVEFRWYIEDALEARTVPEEEHPEAEPPHR